MDKSVEVVTEFQRKFHAAIVLRWWAIVSSELEGLLMDGPPVWTTQECQKLADISGWRVVGPFGTFTRSALWFWRW